jgi:tetratricopeptide (TPR) repeat protein
MKFLALAVVLALVTGCAGNKAFEQGRSLLESGDVEAGLAKIEEAVRLDPGNREYRVYLVRQRESAVQRTIAQGEEARRAAKFDDAETAYRRALTLEPANPRARAGLDALDADRRYQKLIAEADAALKKKDLDTAYARTREILTQNPSHRQAIAMLQAIEQASPPADFVGPQLRARFRKTVSVDFREASLRQIVDFIGRNTGLNFLFDRDVRTDQRTTVLLRDVSVEEALQFLLMTNQLEQRILNDTTLLIYPKTQAKQREYQELVTKSFYLGNASAKQTLNLIKTLVKTRDVFIDEELNLVVMRDTPEAIRMTERLLASQDLAKPEVMLEVEILEVSTQSITDLGIRYPDRISYSLVGAAGNAGAFTLTEWLNRGSEMVHQFQGPARPQQPAGQSPHPGQEPRESEGSHRRQAAGDHHHVDFNRVRFRVGELSRRRAETRRGARDLPRQRRRHQDRARGQQHRFGDPQRLRHHHLPHRHPACEHQPAPQGRRDPDPRRADQRRGPLHRQSPAGSRQPARAR